MIVFVIDHVHVNEFDFGVGITFVYDDGNEDTYAFTHPDHINTLNSAMAYLIHQPESLLVIIRDLGKFTVH